MNNEFLYVEPSLIGASREGHVVDLGPVREMRIQGDSGKDINLKLE